MRSWLLIFAYLHACQGGPTSHDDLDGDGFCVAPGGVWNAKDHVCTGEQGFGDCDDASAEISPAAAEICADGVDNNCNGELDEVTQSDLDGDLHVGSNCPEFAEDCDDNDAAIHPAADEVCDGIDNDCNDLIDDELEVLNYFVDGDGDGFGEQGSDAIVSCGPVEGAVANDEDCDDLAFDRNPGINERCNLVDDNCDGTIDEGSDGRATFYADLDNDGYGAVESGTVDGCREAVEPGWSQDPRDCDDTNANVHPDQLDATCDGVNDNCSASTDEDAGQQNYFLDGDTDGFGAGDATRACPARAPAGWVTLDGDCDDANDQAYPGNATPDLCDGINDDCDDEVDEDAPVNAYYVDGDGDGFGAGSLLYTCDDIGSLDGVTEDGDCNDVDADVNPDGDDVDCDGVDQDCDGREPGCPAQAFWVSATRASGVMELGPTISTDLSTCPTDESWIQLGGYDQTETYDDFIVVPDWTHVHVAWEATHVDEVDIPELGLFGLPNIGSVDFSSIDEDFELILEFDGEELAVVEVLSHAAGPEPDGLVCFVVPHPAGLFPEGAGPPVVMPTPAAECGPDPLNASAPFSESCCSVVDSLPDPWSTTVDSGDHILEFSADMAPDHGRVYRTYGYPTRMETDAFLSLTWDPILQHNLWYRVGLTLSDPSEDPCDLANHEAMSSPWFLDEAMDFWNFGPAYNVDPRFPIRTIGDDEIGVRVVPYVDVYVPESVQAEAAVVIIDPQLVCCGPGCGPRPDPNGCPYDHDGDGAGTWCSVPASTDAWDCDENDPGVHPVAVSTSEDDCHHPEWWASRCALSFPQ